MTTASLTVRRAGPADRAAIGLLCRQEAALQERLNGYPLNPRFDWTAWAHARLAEPHRFFYLAERDNAPLGSIYGHLQTPPASGLRAWLRRRLRRQGPIDAGGWAFIESCFVVEAARRQGIARQLVAALLEAFSRHAATRIALSVMAANAAAVAFWNDQGFQIQRLQLIKSVAAPNPTTRQPSNR